MANTKFELSTKKDQKIVENLIKLMNLYSVNAIQSKFNCLLFTLFINHLNKSEPSGLINFSIVLNSPY